MPTLELTDEEADVVRSALANYADEMTRRAIEFANKVIQEDCLTVAATCDAVVEKLNKAEGRG